VIAFADPLSTDSTSVKVSSKVPMPLVHIVMIGADRVPEDPDPYIISVGETVIASLTASPETSAPPTAETLSAEVSKSNAVDESRVAPVKDTLPKATPPKSTT
jgi:hypothetical protein